MSFTIYWEKLDKRVAQSVQAQLNRFFAQLEPRPAFLGQISVEELDFGSMPPHLEILDLTEPFAEFYLATEDDVSDAPVNPPHADQSERSRYSDIDDDLQSLRPLLQATMRSYLGARMDTLVRSGAMTPVWCPSPQLFRTPLQRHQQPHAGAAHAVMPGEVAVEQTKDDMQLKAKVEYRGDMAVVLKMELQLNYPATQFVSLPVTMHITKIEFAAVAVVAYLSRRVNFCFLEPDPPRTSLLDGFAVRTEIGDAGRHVLKNVEKLESFIANQLRKAIDDEFVFPSYHSFELN